MAAKIIVINLVGLTLDVLARMPKLASRFQDKPEPVLLQPALPAVTCTSQATMTTGTTPDQHGIVSNGWYFRESAEVRFWLRSDGLVQGEKIWEAAAKARPGITVANLFWRYATHAKCSVTVTERPTYWANGRKSPDVFTNPDRLRDELVDRLGEFPLFRFWGPATSIESSQWIADATRYVIESADPDLTLTYLPHLDYDLQKYGPESVRADQAISEIDSVASQLVDFSRSAGRQVMVLSEYGMTSVQQPVFLNRHLRQGGFVSVQNAQNGEILEPGNSRAFAACSHQTAHVYVANSDDVNVVQRQLGRLQGVDRVLDRDQMRAANILHDRSGELFLIAAPGYWFAYPYWLDDKLAPDFARCVAIHDKPGHDPAEMLLGPGGKAKAIRRLIQSRLGFRVPFDVISLRAQDIRGSHGRLPDRPQDCPLLLADWGQNLTDKSQQRMQMTLIKRLVLNRLVEDA